MGKLVQWAPVSTALRKHEVYRNKDLVLLPSVPDVR